MNQEQRQTQKTLLSQRMIQSAEILQMDAQELEQYIEKAASENPMIDLEEMEQNASCARGEKTDTEQEKEDALLKRKLEWLNRADEQNRVYYGQEAFEEKEREAWNVSKEDNTLRAYLMSQLFLEFNSEKERNIMEFLIDSLDERGYLTDSIGVLAESLGLPEEELVPYLKRLKELEPAGVGAKDLSECLRLQLDRLLAAGRLEKDRYSRLSVLAGTQLEALSRKHFEKAALSLGTDRATVEADYRMLQSLNPIPGNAFGSREDMRYVKPDVAVVKFDGYFEVLVNDLVLPKISADPYYLSLMKESENEEVRVYLEKKYQQMEWMRHCITERSDTLQRVTEVLVSRQQAFFENPNGKRSPMGLKDVAESIGVHSSTVSRTIKNKFLQCARGVYPMSFFFQRTAVRDENGTGMTPEGMKRRIRALITAENKQKPLSDQRIANLLLLEGTPLSRRTVAKYRAELLIPDASGRRE